MAGSRNVRATKEAFHIRVEASDGSVAFYNATEYVGKTMPFSKPRATCAMRVAADAVSFSLLHLTNKNASLIAAKPITIPRGPLSRLERRAVSYAPLTSEQLIVEISTRVSGSAGESSSGDSGLGDLFDAGGGNSGLDDLFAGDSGAADTDSGLGDLFDAGSVESANGGEKTADGNKQKRPMRPAVIETFRCTLKRDEHGVAHIEAEEDEHIFELPKGALHVSLYLASPVAAVKRVLAVGFIGHVGKPGAVETVSRVAAMVLNSITHLPDFRILSQIETCQVPANPARGQRAAAPAKRADERVQFPVRVFLFDDQHQPIVNGYVGCEIDLENANPTTGKLLVTYTPEEALAGVFDRYRSVFDAAVAQHLRVKLGEDTLSEIVYDVVLGSITGGTVEVLRDCAKAMSALDLTPAQFREHA